MDFDTIKKCRICGNENLKTIVDLGDMVLTGVFPNPSETVDSCPLELVKCWDDNQGECCGLVQLRHTYNLGKMYGETYGYRSGLNKSMVHHLQGLVKEVENRVKITDDDLIVDIASNDGVLLAAYSNQKAQLVGIDPSAEKFKEHYLPNAIIFSDFFSSDLIKLNFQKKAKVVTSVAVFYDLDNPRLFAEHVRDILAEDGIWVLEQSYLPTMIDQCSYDTICHEHLEYYALEQIDWLMKQVQLRIIDVDFNDANGGSFRVTVAHDRGLLQSNTTKIQNILAQEKKRGFHLWPIYEEFTEKTRQHKTDLTAFVKNLQSSGKVVAGYGASTKGNVILQYCNFSAAEFPFIAEVNEYKFGRVTPGTQIPIVSEEEAKKMKPDFLLVLPWHFRENIIKREQKYLEEGGHLIFPLPKIEIV